jgi:hypothetical protein
MGDNPFLVNAGSSISRYLARAPVLSGSISAAEIRRELAP